MFVGTALGRMGKTQLRTCARGTSEMSLRIVNVTTFLQRRGTIQVSCVVWAASLERRNYSLQLKRLLIIL
jgi:hypothetical protein